jgi:glutathione synthase/RimK-type ligase-like ATP-grasp enzyme
MTHHLNQLGHEIVRSKEEKYDVILCWGMSTQGLQKPALNGRVNQYDKYDCFKEFEKAGVLCPTTFSVNEGIHRNAKVAGETWLARKTQHTKGKDIEVCKTYDDVKRVYHNGKHAFFSVFIPTDTEYRVWVLGKNAFAIYEKVFKGEGEYEGFMRNHRFGFKFVKRDDLRGTKAIEQPCIAAVKSVGMDWGAVDILKGKDGKYYMLEINSMPHIDSTERSSGVRLAAAVSKWAEEQ